MNPSELSGLQQIFVVGVGLTVVLILIWAARRSDFTIRVRDGRVACHGRIPESLHGPLTQFFLDDLVLSGPITVWGRWESGRLVLWFRGGLSAGQRQRVRNFLVSRL